MIEAKKSGIYSACIATCITLALAHGSIASEFGTCTVKTTAPQAVANALDDIVLKAVDPNSPVAGIFGYAPGAVLSVQATDWRYVRAIGVSDTATGAAMDCAMPFQIGSNTKIMTATVLLQLAEEGRLTLDDPLAQHLPEIADAIPNGDKILVRHLAQHTSGVFSYTDNAPDGTPGIMEGDIADPKALSRGYRPEQLIEFVIEHGEANFDPGADGQWSYSNSGYVLLGLIIEKVEGQPLGKSFENRIFGPLRMADTYLWNEVPSKNFGLPRAFFQAPFDVETTDWNLSQGWAAGGVVSTVEDMHAFIGALLDGELFRDPTTLNVMQEAVVTGMPSLSRYGIGLGEKEPGLWGHGGQTLGFESDVAQFVAQGISVVGFATSSQNIMSLGALSVAETLRQNGVIEDAADAATDALKANLKGTAWQLLSIETNGEADEIVSPERYELRFVDEKNLQVGADCNRVLGEWHLDKLVLGILLGPSTLAACPPDSRADVFLAGLENTISASRVDDTLSVFSNNETGFTVLNFQEIK